MSSSRVFLKESVAFRGPEGLLNAIATAAKREYTTPPEFLRRTIIGHLRDMGVPLEPAEGDAGGASAAERAA